MTLDHAGFRRLLADDVRWHILEQLARSDRKVQELVASSGRPQNLVSYHLGKLRRAGLITQGRSAADARDVYCRLNLDRFTELYARAAGGVQPAFALVGPMITRLESFQPVQIQTSVRPWRVLFICTGNSARSQMAEAFTRELSRGTLLALSHGPVEAESAGTAPQQVHPMAIRVMKDLGLSIEHQRSKSPDAVRDHHFDQVITVCDRARACDPIPGMADPLHWSLPDPREAAGTQDQVYEVFRASALEIAAHVRQLPGRDRKVPTARRFRRETEARIRHPISNWAGPRRGLRLDTAGERRLAATPCSWSLAARFWPRSPWQP